MEMREKEVCRNPFLSRAGFDDENGNTFVSIEVEVAIPF